MYQSIIREKSYRDIIAYVKDLDGGYSLSELTCSVVMQYSLLLSSGNTAIPPRVIAGETYDTGKHVFHQFVV